MRTELGDDYDGGEKPERFSGLALIAFTIGGLLVGLCLGNIGKWKELERVMNTSRHHYVLAGVDFIRACASNEINGIQFNPQGLYSNKVYQADQLVDLREMGAIPKWW